MKRYLYLVRHATAEEGSSYFNDFTRELTPFGMIEAARVGKYLKDSDLVLDYIVTSSGTRAFQTAKVLSEQLKYPVEKIVATKSLYEDGVKGYMAALTEAPKDARIMMLVGHNPDISFFAEYLTHAQIENMKKGSVVMIEFEDLEWNEVSARTGRFIEYFTPKSIYES